MRALDGSQLGFHKTPALFFAMDLASYVSGFVDGEGCFCVSFTPSRRHRFGWEVRPSFSVSQNGDRSEILRLIQDMWGCGSVRPDRSDKTLKFEVRKIEDLIHKVLPHFKSYPLQSSKQRDVELFGQICQLVYQRQHLTEAGIVEIVRLAVQMNPSGKRRYSGSEILASLRAGEGIVYATGNCGST